MDCRQSDYQRPHIQQKCIMSDINRKWSDWNLALAVSRCRSTDFCLRALSIALVVGGVHTDCSAVLYWLMYLINYMLIQLFRPTYWRGSRGHEHWCTDYHCFEYLNVEVFRLRKRNNFKHTNVVCVSRTSCRSIPHVKHMWNADKMIDK